MQFCPSNRGVCLRGTGWISVWGQFCTKPLLLYALSEPASITFSAQWQVCERKEGCHACIAACIATFRAFFKEIVQADLKDLRLRGEQLLCSCWIGTRGYVVHSKSFTEQKNENPTQKLEGMCISKLSFLLSLLSPSHHPPPHFGASVSKQTQGYREVLKLWLLGLGFTTHPCSQPL